MLAASLFMMILRSVDLLMLLGLMIVRWLLCLIFIEMFFKMVLFLKFLLMFLIFKIV